VRIAAIIPAYNEEKNIGPVLSVVKQVKELTDILVVSDGSTDRTADIARSFGLRTIELPYNMGKSYAMKIGLENTSAPFVLFLDADLIGVKPYHIKNLIMPVYQDAADMTLGVFSCGRGVTDFAQRLTPFLTGQRAVKRWILDTLKHEDWTTGYGIEAALTRYAREQGLRVMEIPLLNVTHSLKEEKMGLGRGMVARLKMYWEITKELNRF
jgi:glycosyltransferase involved in cell wall biosynthesis